MNTWRREWLTMDQQAIEQEILDSVRCDIYGDCYGHDRAAEGIAAAFAAKDREIARLKQALLILADPTSWQRDNICDPNSSNFQGLQIAQSTLGL